MRQVYEEEDVAYMPRRFIPLKLKVLFWLLVVLFGVYSFYALLPFPRLVLEIAQAGHVVFLWTIHR